MHATKRLPKWLEAHLSLGNVLRLGLAAAAVAVAASPAPAATITVTTTNQEVNTDADCSLQEAIFAANFDAAIAVDPLSTSSPISTGCAAGSGFDTIVLAAGATYLMSGIVQDPFNHLGPTATPLIFTAVNIQGNGARLERVGGLDIRLFSVAPVSTTWNSIVYSSQGSMELRDAHIVSFRARGGDGSAGGGGGLGAGGAIYLEGGIHAIERCTFEGNTATGGNGGTALGSAGAGGGGGGLGGDGGSVVAALLGGGGGGGGARGNGGSTTFNPAGSGGGGGGTVNNGVNGLGANVVGGNGGFACGGGGGDHGTAGTASGLAGSCDGGGGGGGAGGDGSTEAAGNGGDGAYGGGGGGGGAGDQGGVGIGDGGDGGGGGFGGGGGAGGVGVQTSGNGGDAGFGGGGGGAFTGASVGSGGPFAGAGSIGATGGGGGGGAGLGGAIFASGYSGPLDFIVRHCTFYGNSAYGGAGGSGAPAGEAQGQFFVTGLATLAAIQQSTFAGGNSGDVVAFDTDLALFYCILADGVGGAQNCKLFGTVDTSNTGANIVEVNGSGSAGPCPGSSLVDPQLGPLTLNAPGLTPTMAIPSTSPAYDALPPVDPVCAFPANASDQRGIARPQGVSCDLGAYELVEIAIDVDTVPGGLGITVDSTAYTAPQSFTWAMGSPHTIAAISPQGAGGTRYVWTSWDDAGAISHSVSPLADATFTASFQTQYELATVALPPAGGTVTPVTGYHDAGSIVAVSASPAAGWGFSGFSGALTGVATPQQVTMDAPHVVAANFVQAIPALRGAGLALLLALIAAAGLLAVRRSG